MHIYLFGYFLLFLGIILAERCRPKIKLIYIIGFIYIAFIAIFRADVGTDTGTYELIISNISFESWHKQPTELGFNFISALLKEISSSSKVILRILTAIYFILLYIAISTSPSNIKKYLLIYFVPATIFVFSMNIIRVGIAMNLVVLAINFFNKKNLIAFALFCLSLSFHVSMIAVVPIILVFQKNNSKKILLLLFASLFIMLFLVIYEQHITNKFLLYSTSSKVLSISSGISSLIVFILMLPFYYFYTDKKSYKIKFILISTSLILLSFIIAKFSYAGLRILSLYLLLLPIIFIHISDSRNEKTPNLKLPSICFWSLYIASFVNVLFILRNFASTQGQEYGFIPYYFIFN